MGCLINAVNMKQLGELDEGKVYNTPFVVYFWKSCSFTTGNTICIVEKVWSDFPDVVFFSPLQVLKTVLVCNFKSNTEWESKTE